MATLAGCIRVYGEDTMASEKGLRGGFMRVESGQLLASVGWFRAAAA